MLRKEIHVVFTTCVERKPSDASKGNSVKQMPVVATILKKIITTTSQIEGHNFTLNSETLTMVPIHQCYYR